MHQKASGILIKPLASMPKPPDYFGEDARYLWNEVGKKLIQSKSITVGDLTAFEALCQTYAAWRIACTDFFKAGSVVSDSGRGMKTHPAVAAMVTLGRTLDGLCASFHLSPMARSRAGIVTSRSAKKDPLSNIGRPR